MLNNSYTPPKHVQAFLDHHWSFIYKKRRHQLRTLKERETIEQIELEEKKIFLKLTITHIGLHKLEELAVIEQDVWCQFLSEHWENIYSKDREALKYLLDDTPSASEILANNEATVQHEHFVYLGLDALKNEFEVWQLSSLGDAPLIETER